MIVGAGYAGLAAALTLVDAGCAPRVLEAAPVAGGRARRISSPAGEFDNGQHLLLGAYRTLLGLIDRVHAGAAAPYRRLPLRMLRPGRLDLRAPRLPAPFHLAAAVLACRGLALADRLATLAFWRRLQRCRFRAPDEASVATLLAGQPAAAVELLWAPLCIAALNTRPIEASAQVFLNVLRVAFGGRRSDSDLVLPATDLSALFPEPACRLIEAAGGEILLRTPVLAISRAAGGGWTAHTRGGEHTAPALILAVGPHQLAGVLADSSGLPPRALALRAAVEALDYEPIVTVYLRGPALPALPFPMLQLDGEPGEWLVDRGALGLASQGWAVVTSAANRLANSGRAKIVEAVLGQLRRDWPGLAAPDCSYVVTERRATFRCSVRRPEIPGPHLGDGLFVAGDFAHRDYPATLEAAAETGVAAARGVLGASAPGGASAIPVR